MAQKRRYLHIFLVVLACVVLSTVFFAMGKTNCFAMTNIELVSTREAFATALSKKQTVINVGDIDFGSTPISIDITYSVEIVGKSEKSVFSNAHFNIVGGSNPNSIVIVTIKNIKFDGCVNTREKVLESGKTFAENFETNRTNPIYRAIVPTGLLDLKIENCEFFNYASQSGAVICRFNTESSSAYSKIDIINTKVHDIIGEESPLYFVDKNLILNIKNSEFYQNKVQFCGGISIFGANSELDGVKIHDNEFVNFCSIYDKYSGGLFVASTDIIVKNSSICNNSSYNGGGVQLTNANATFYNCKILNNKAFSTGTSKAGILYCEGGYGGGVFVISGEGQIARFENCNISSNSAKNGGAIAVMPSYQNAKGGRVELMFCNIGLNGSQDGEAVKYYGYNEQNKGTLTVKGSIIIDETTLQSDADDYNYISTKEQALLDGVITTEIINNISVDGLNIVSNSSADRYVPRNVFQNWDMYSSSKGSRKIGMQENVTENSDLKLIVALSLTGIIVLAGLIYLAVMLSRRKAKLASVSIAPKQVEKMESTESHEKTNFTSEQIEKILNNATADVLLSKKEVEVFRLALLGKSRKEMAQVCNVTEHTIKKHLSNIYEKLGVGTRKKLYEKSKQYLD